MRGHLIVLQVTALSFGPLLLFVLFVHEAKAIKLMMTKLTDCDYTYNQKVTFIPVLYT